MSEITDALEGLIGHPGWRAFQQHVASEWGPVAYAHKLKQTVVNARSKGKDASLAIELVDAGNDAIADAMRWPAEELAKRKRQEVTPELTLSRRGGL